MVYVKLDFAFRFVHVATSCLDALFRTEIQPINVLFEQKLGFAFHSSGSIPSLVGTSRLLVGGFPVIISPAMKKKVHPTYYNNVKVTCSCGNTFITG